MTATTSQAVPDMSGDSDRKQVRDRYLDLLRAVAIVRVIVFHTFGFPWLSFAFPAMGVMFALGGSLMANSMARSTSRAVRGRLRRLLPALWAMGLILVPMMMIWSRSRHEDLSFPVWALGLWVIPVAQPPGAPWATCATEVLWYLVTYLWFVLLSPVAWWAYRRAPLPTLLAPTLALVATLASPLALDGPFGATVVDVTTFGTCWIVGFAHRSGQLRRLAPPRLAVLAGGCVALGVAWAVTHPTDEGLNLNEIPIAQALYSVGFVLILLRISPKMGWLSRVRPLDAAVTALNSRAVTTYLWHNVAIQLCFPLGDLILVWRLGSLAIVGYVLLALALLAAAVIALGWVEDLAARRALRLLPPTGRRRGGRS